MLPWNIEPPYHSWRAKIPKQRMSLYDNVMLVYLITGAWLMPMFVLGGLETLGVLSLSEKNTPDWLYGYQIFTTMMAAFCLFVAWIPALYLCFRFRDKWRVIVPSFAVLMVCLGLLLESKAEIWMTVSLVSAIIYVISSFSIGLEWLICMIKKTDVR